MAKLACYFEGSDKARILEPNGEVVRIGRGVRSGDSLNCIHFNDPRVSRYHARLRHITRPEHVPGRPEAWQIHDGKPTEEGNKPSENGTWKSDPRSNDERISQGWVEIEEGDRFFFGSPGCWVLCSYIIDDTLRVVNAFDTQTGSGIEEDSKPTQKHWMAEVVLTILNGPKGMPNWLWWLILAGIGVVYIVWG